MTRLPTIISSVYGGTYAFILLITSIYCFVEVKQEQRERKMKALQQGLLYLIIPHPIEWESKY